MEASRFLCVALTVTFALVQPVRAEAGPVPTAPLDATVLVGANGPVVVAPSAGDLEAYKKSLEGLLGAGALVTPPPPAPGKPAAPPSEKSSKDAPIPGFDKVAVKKCGHLRTWPGLKQASEALQSADPQAREKARAILQDTIDQIGKVLANPSVAAGIPHEKELREGNQCKATREALALAEHPESDSTSLKTAIDAAQKKSSPILLDLNGNGIADVTTPDVTGRTGAFVAEGSVRFDISGQGRNLRTEWLKPGQDGLLFLDRNGNGLVDDVRELFGDQDGFDDGYAKLSILDSDRDGSLAGRELGNLGAWIDDGDGICESGEVTTVRALGIGRIQVGHEDYASTFERNGHSYRTWDWFPQHE